MKTKNKTLRKKIRTLIITNKFLIILGILSMILIFTNLGNRFLFIDESENVILSKTIF